MKYNSIEMGIIEREGSGAFCKRCADQVRYDPTSKLCFDCLTDLKRILEKV